MAKAARMRAIVIGNHWASRFCVIVLLMPFLTGRI